MISKSRFLLIMSTAMLFFVACKKEVAPSDGTSPVTPTVTPGIITLSCDNRPIINTTLTQVGSLSEGRKSLVSAAVGNKILFAGGFRPGAYSSRVDIYDIVNNTWATAELSKPERQGMAVATVGNKVLFAGGGDNEEGDVTSRVDIYDASTNTWAIAELSKAREYLTATTLGTRVFFAGGGSWEPNLKGSTVVDIYDNSTNSWSTDSLSEGRMDHTATVVGNKIYFAGGTKGYYTSLGVLSSIDIFDASTNLWSTGTLQEPKMSMASAYIDGKILWAGGHSSASWGHGFTLSQRSEIRTENSGATSFACTLPRAGLDAVVSKDKVIFFTGSNGDGIHYEIYNASTNTWLIGRLNRRIYNATIISVNGIVYVAGGSDDAGPSCYDQLWKLEF